MQPQPSSPTSFSMSPRQHLRLRDIKTIARLMGRFIKVEKEVILRLLRIAKEKPSSPDSSGRPPKQKLRLRDMKTLARLMVRLTEVEKEVIWRLLHIAEEKGKEIKQESAEVESQPLSPDSSGRPSGHKLRLCDMKILAGLMVRLTEEEKEVISRLLHIVEEKEEEIKQESTEVELTPDKNSKAPSMIETTNIEDSNEESKNM
ncbi:hypothetical protein HAX54_007204 [Datura stramonium]|uniref:Uncharacterized protein n=1 Tax=Datura stramonium TaxID=4076 RepID=A0ABS8RWD4_DATST|nr:hypothetical protein [Datura stramonium]